MSNISRSVYQKVCEENKRMRQDLYNLCYLDIESSEENTSKWFETMQKWREIFEKEKEFRRLLKGAAIQYFKDHPEIREQHPNLFPIPSSK